jgi:rubredoxin-NAD+ reductase
MHAHPANPIGTTASDRPAQTTAPHSPAPLVVVGAGMAGWTTVREFRKLDSLTQVIVVTADSGDFYAKPGLSNALAQKRTPAQLVSTPAAKMVETLNVTLLPFSTVTGIATAGRALTVQSQGASQTLAYSQLVLATGAQPIRSALAGNATDQVLSVNSLQDFAEFHARLTGSETPPPHGSDGGNPRPVSNGQSLPKTVLVIGAGLIGCEFANDLLQAGHHVHVVDPSPRPLAALLPEAAGLQLQTALQKLGVHWHFGTTVQAVNTTDVAEPKATHNATDFDAAGLLSVTLADGSQIAVDAVLSAIGLRADTALASASGLVCERGMVVDRFLQTSAEAVFALGDAAQYASADRRTLPYVMPIMHAAKALAATLNGNRTELVFPLMPVSIKTPALPIVVAAAHPALVGNWVAEVAEVVEMAETSGVWRFLDNEGAQHGFVLTGKSTARRAELSQATQNLGTENRTGALP